MASPKVVLILPEHGGVEIDAGGTNAVVRSGLTPALLAVIQRLLDRPATAADGVGHHTGEI